MNKDIQPELFEVEAKCISCNSVINTKSTRKNIRVDSCSECHPFYTNDGSKSMKDGRADRFNKKFNRAKDAAKTTSKKQEDSKE